MIEREIGNPSPTPPDLVVKKGSNSRSAPSGSKPAPLSSTDSTTPASASTEVRIDRIRAAASCWRRASTPFSTRLSSTCCSCTWSPRTGGRAGSRSNCTNTWARARWSSVNSSTSPTSRLRSRDASSGSVRAIIDLTLWITAPARWPSRSARSIAAVARARSGGSRASQRMEAWLLATMAATGWLISCAIEEASSPTDSTRATCATSA